MRTPTWCRRRAAEVGPACEVVIGELLAENALFRLRAAQGVLGLGDKHAPARLEAACAKATTAGDPSYRTIKGILAAGTETTQTARPTGDAGAPAHLHGPDQLFAVPDTHAFGDVVLADVIPLSTARGAHATDPATTTPAPGTATALSSSEALS
jgi:hypothetical protein